MSLSFNINRNPPAGTDRWRQWAVAVVLSILPATTTQAFQTLLAAGNEQDLWVLKLNTDGTTGGFTLLYRDHLDAANTLHRVTTLQGQIISNGMACAQRRLWLVYKSTSSQPNLTVQSIRVVPEPNVPTQRYRFEPPEFQPSLPQGITLQSLAANKHGPWALIRVKDQNTLRQIDDSQAPSKTQQVDDTPASQSPSTHTLLEPDKSQDLPKDRLLHLVRNQWVKVPLPDNWPQDARSQLVTRRQDERYPLLVTIVPGENQLTVRTYQYDGQTWTPQQFSLRTEANHQSPDGLHPISGSAHTRTAALALAAVVTAVDGQIVLGFAKALHKKLEWNFSVLRSTTTTALGSLSMDYEPSWPWAIVPHAQTAAILVNTGQTQLAWSRIDLQGHTTPAIDFSSPIVKPLSETADYLVLMSVVVASTLIMFIFWRREPTKNRLDLPKNVSVAPLSRRAAAGAIDFLPGAVVVMIFFRIAPSDLIHHWPGRAGGWHPMLPGTVAIGFFVLHTLISELFTAKTIGKAIVGLRVTTLEGHPPNVWQAITRNLMKVFDLIAWPLLIMPLIAPYRQRLGDLVARTLVIDSPTRLTQGADRPTKKTNNTHRDT